MALARRDDWVTDALGQALAGAQVYYCAPQPANTSTIPPSPLAPVYSDSGGTPADNPQETDGFGHAVAYLSDSQLYTIVVVHPLFGDDPVVLPDQAVSSGGGGISYLPFQGTPAGTIDGTNATFTVMNGGSPLTVLPTQISATLNYPLVPGVGFSVFLDSGVVKITYATAPQPAVGSFPADTLYAQGLYAL